MTIAQLAVRSTLLAGLVVALTTCTVGDLSSEGRPCSTTVPCGPGATCEPQRGICVKIASDGPSDRPVLTERRDLPIGDGRPDRSFVDLRRSDAKDDLPSQDKKTGDAGACTPSCSGTKAICCPSTKTCVSSLTECTCDVSTGEPCVGSYPVCCDKGGGAGPRCQGTPDSCLCSKITSNPCFGSFPTCCDKSPDGGAPTFKCYASTSGCKP
jgi:hypothetical protein